MRFSLTTGLSRSSVAATALRRHRSSAHGRLALAVLRHTCGSRSGTPTVTTTPIIIHNVNNRNGVVSSLRRFLSAPVHTASRSFAAAAAPAAVLIMPRRFEAGSSPVAASSDRAATAAISTATKFRHRRGAHRKRGGGDSGSNARGTTTAMSPLVKGANGDVADDVVTPPLAPAASAAVASAADGKEEKEAAMPLRHVKEAAEAAASKKRNRARKDAVAAGSDDVEGKDADAQDADAIMRELISSSKLNGDNGHAFSSVTVVEHRAPTASKRAKAKQETMAESVGSDAAAAMTLDMDGPADDKEKDDDNKAVTGAKLKQHRRNSRTRSSKRRRGTPDGHASAVKNSVAPSSAAAAAEGSVTAAKEAAEAGVEDSASPHLASSSKVVAAAAAAAATADTETSGEKKTVVGQKAINSAVNSGEDDANSIATGDDGALSAVVSAVTDAEAEAASTSRRKKSKRGRKSNRAVPPMEAAEAEMKKEATTVKSEAAASDPAEDEDATAVEVAEGEEAAATATARAEPLAPSPSSAASPRTSSGRRARRGKRGRATEERKERGMNEVGSTTKLSSFSLLTIANSAGKEHESASTSDVEVAAPDETSTGPSEPAPVKAPERNKKRVAASEAELEAAVTAALRDAASSKASSALATATVTTTNSIALSPPPPSSVEDNAEAATTTTTSAAAAAAAAAAAGGSKEKKRRGRKKKTTAAAACVSAEEAEVAAVDKHVDKASTPPLAAAVAPATTTTVTDDTDDLADTLATDAHLPKSMAAALKKLLATGSSGNVGGGAASTLVAKKRLAAQIIRRRWQLQQELKGRKTAPAKTQAPSTQPPPPSQQQRRNDDDEPEDKATAVEEAQAPSVDTAAVVAAMVDKEASTAKRKKGTRKDSTRRRAAAAAAAHAIVMETTTITASKADAPATPTAAAEVVSNDDEAAEAARDAEVAAAIKAALALAAMPVADLQESEGTRAAASQGLSSSLSSTADDDGKDVAARAGLTNTPRSLAMLVARSQNVVTSAAARADLSASKPSKNGGKTNSGSGSRGGGSDKNGSSSSGGGNKGANSRDTLYYPDYRERVLQIFEQMAEINSALGERYKALSYSNTVERLKRGDKVFQLLPPNLLPLPEDSPKWKSPLMEEGATASAVMTAQKRAKEVEENRAKRNTVLSSENLLPGVGQKLRLKITEILQTGDLQELHKLEAKPLIRAIRELTQVHGFGPRTAIEFFKKYNITSVKELQDCAVKKGELDMGNKSTGKPAGLTATMSGNHKAGFHLNDAQRLGLVYYKDMCHRIPHDEGRLHEAFMKLRLRKYLGKDYELVVCGSYRRQVETSGDIDVLITRKRASDGSLQSTLARHLPPREVLATFLSGLKADHYIEATLAQGPTKFMGLCRLRVLPPPAGKLSSGTTTATSSGSSSSSSSAAAAPSMPRFRARRLDIRYVDTDCFPAAMLYFTGSKNFNVIMRSEAIKKRCILNEYGLFRKFSRKQQLQRQAAGEKALNLHEMITQVARFGFASMKEIVDGNTNPDSAAAEETEECVATPAVESAEKKIKKKSKEKTKAELEELCEVARLVERQRVKAHTEKEIFDALDMDYVQPKDRNV